MLVLLALIAGLVTLGCDEGRTDGRVVVERDSPATQGARLAETVGIEVSYGEVEPILERGCPLPCEETVTFGTAMEEQTEVLVYVFRGNDRRTEASTSLGVYEISGFPLASGVEPEVQVVFQADAGGVFLSPSPPGASTRIRRLTDEEVAAEPKKGDRFQGQAGPGPGSEQE